jgi:hypothetical protein
MLSCPACSSLVHAEQLKGLALVADEAAVAGDLLQASQSWQQALDLLPPSSQQHAAITTKLDEITKRLAERPQRTAVRGGGVGRLRLQRLASFCSAS